MHLYEDQFLEAHDFPRSEEPSKVLIIASTQRCGSHMLGHALYQTGKFGYPLEYANGANLSQWKKLLRMTDFHQVMAELQRKRTSPNGVFGIKVHHRQLKQFGGFQKLEAMFPDAYYVMLSRHDVLAQAVSQAIARQTGVWISGQKPVRDDPSYSFEDIHDCLRANLLDTASWRYVLSASGANYMELSFDQVRMDLRGSIQRIADFMDVEVGDIPLEPVTDKQGSPLNQEWRERFLAEFDHSRLLMPKVDPSKPGKPSYLQRIMRRLKCGAKS